MKGNLIRNNKNALVRELCFLQKIPSGRIKKYKIPFPLNMIMVLPNQTKKRYTIWRWVTFQSLEVRVIVAKFSYRFSKTLQINLKKKIWSYTRDIGLKIIHMGRDNSTSTRMVNPSCTHSSTMTYNLVNLFLSGGRCRRRTHVGGYKFPHISTRVCSMGPPLYR